MCEVAAIITERADGMGVKVEIRENVRESANEIAAAKTLAQILLGHVEIAKRRTEARKPWPGEEGGAE